MSSARPSQSAYGACADEKREGTVKSLKDIAADIVKGALAAGESPDTIAEALRALHLAGHTLAGLAGMIAGSTPQYWDDDAPDYPDWVHERGLEGEAWVHDRWGK